MSSTPVSKYLFEKLPEESKASTPKDQRDHAKDTMDKYSNLLEYSSLDNQVMPKSVDSSPDFELQHRKLFSKRVSSLASNITLLNNYCSEEESDESFVRMERLIRGPFKNDICDSENQISVPKTPESKPHIADDKNDISQSNKKSINMSSLIDGFNLLRVDSSSIKLSPSLNSLNDSLDISKNKEIEKDACRAPVSIVHKDSLETTKNESRKEDLDESLNSLNDSLDISNDNKENIKDFYHAPVSIVQKDSSEVTKDESCKDPDESLKFNDTLEEMEYYMNQGAKKFVVKEPEKIVIPHIQNEVKETSQKPFKKSSYETSIPKICINDKFLKPNTSKKQATPIHKLTPFKMPLGTLTPRNNTPVMKTPNSGIKLSNCNRKYDDIISPIRHYIKNSPTVPLVKNVSPARNYWDRVPREPISRLTKLYKNAGEKSPHLPEKAYKSPKVTKMVCFTSNS